MASFQSTVSRAIPRQPPDRWRWLTDPNTGAPVGVQNWNGSGEDGYWAPIDLTANQIASPSVEMLADLNAVYRLNVAPYTRYYSNGTILLTLSGSDPTYGVQAANGLFGNMIVYSPFTITDTRGIEIQGTVSVRDMPA